MSEVDTICLTWASLVSLMEINTIRKGLFHVILAHFQDRLSFTGAWGRESLGDILNRFLLFFSRYVVTQQVITTRNFFDSSSRMHLIGITVQSDDGVAMLGIRQGATDQWCYRGGPEATELSNSNVQHMSSYENTQKRVIVFQESVGKKSNKVNDKSQLYLQTEVEGSRYCSAKKSNIRYISVSRVALWGTESAAQLLYCTQRSYCAVEWLGEIGPTIGT